MKKSRSMRLASALLVCTLLSTCMISGTFAKYTTQDSGSDSARVAKWGVELQVVGDLYSDGYIKTINTAKEDNSKVSVQSYSTTGTYDNVVAPGTKNTDSGLSFTLKGKPEVSTKVTTKVIAQNISLTAGNYGVMVKVPEGTVTAANYEELKDELYTLNGSTYSPAKDTMSASEYYTLEDAVKLDKNYYPVVYGMNSTNEAEKFTGTINDDSIKLVAQEVLKRSASGENVTMGEPIDGVLYTVTKEKEYAPNKDLAELLLSDTNLTWEWKICSDTTTCADAEIGDSAQIYCKADTILGYMIAEHKDNKETSAVVYKSSAAAKDYTAVTYNHVDEAKDGAEYEFGAYDYAVVGDKFVASLTTQFAIDITVTQVD